MTDKNAIIGIDYGTSKSVVAEMHEGMPRVIPDHRGHPTFPSLVMVAPDERIHVGWDALAHPDRYQGKHFTISSIKRLLGRSGETEWGHFRTYPQEISALILGCLKMQAETWLDAPVCRAIIAVPAHYDINQRWATIQAAEIAGLSVTRLVNEATAAVLSYSRMRRKREGRALVFDLGGGTLDVSVVEFSDGLFDVKATAGDDRLGGDDFDRVIMDHVSEQVKQTGFSSAWTDLQELVLREASARAKIELSDTLATRICIPGFLGGTGRYADLDVTLNREDFETLSGKLFERAAAVLKKAIAAAGNNRLTDVLLVGGTTRMPRIQRLVKEVTGMKPSAEANSVIGVAQGAALLAGICAGELKDTLLIDVTTDQYSVALKDNLLCPIIERNVTVPVMKSKTFATTEDNQQELTVRVYQGESALLSNSAFVGEVHLRGLTAALAGQSPIEVTFGVDVNNTLSVSAKEQKTGKDVQAVMEAPYKLNPAQVKVLCRKVEKTLVSVRQVVMEIRERKLDAAVRDEATNLAEKIKQFLAGVGKELDDEGVKHLAVGAVLIEDYILRDAPRSELKRLIDSLVTTQEQVLRRQEDTILELEMVDALRKKAEALATQIGEIVSSLGHHLSERCAAILSAEKSSMEEGLVKKSSHDDLVRLIASARTAMEEAGRELTIGFLETIRRFADPLPWSAESGLGSAKPTTFMEEYLLYFREPMEFLRAIFHASGSVWRESMEMHLSQLVLPFDTLGLHTCMLLHHISDESWYLARNFIVTDPTDHQIYTLFLRSILDSENNESERRSAAEEIRRLHGGRECFFLLEHLKEESNDEIRRMLEECIRGMPQGAWFKRFRDLSATERVHLVLLPVAAECMRRDMVWVLDTGDPNTQLGALDYFETFGAGENLPDLINILAHPLEEAVKIRLISVVASAREAQVILPLFMTMIDERDSIRRSGVVALAEHREFMDADFRKFFDIAHRCIVEGSAARWHDRFFLWTFGRKHRELKDCIQALKK